MKPRIMRASTRPTAKAEAKNFVGSVMSDPVWAPEGPSRLRASRVTFMPGGRTNWHQHAVGQILYVLSGVGRYQLDGQPVQEIRPGDTVQEALSLADRFGLVITFLAPTQDRYLEIVRALAATRGAALDEEELRRRALQWATRHNGLSGRTARQFVDHLVGELGLAARA